MMRFVFLPLATLCIASAELRGQEAKHLVRGPIRVFYYESGDDAVPATDTNQNGIPDRAEDVMLQAWAAYKLFCEELKFPSPLAVSAIRK